MMDIEKDQTKHFPCFEIFAIVNFEPFVDCLGFEPTKLEFYWSVIAFHFAQFSFAIAAYNQTITFN